jgi:hypothetical protein
MSTGGKAGLEKEKDMREEHCEIDCNFEIIGYNPCVPME